MKVTYEDHMGSDLKVVNAARVSFAKRKTVFGEGDARLIQFLARGCTSGDWDNLVTEVAENGYFWMRDDHAPDRENLVAILKDMKSQPTHWTPFGHCQATLIMKAPIFVARQLFKHKVGSVENEMSRRYVTTEPEFWTPEEWRLASLDKKQGSAGPLSADAQRLANEEHQAFLRCALQSYEYKLSIGVCPEQARADLPQSMYTEWWVTGSLYYWASLFNARSREDTQKETQEVARMIGEIMAPLYPVSWKALTE